MSMNGAKFVWKWQDGKNLIKEEGKTNLINEIKQHNSTLKELNNCRKKML